MNKYIYIITFFLGLFTINAQIAPNLSLTDIDGNNHDIYEILDEGKTVILDFFIENCSPCHESVPYMNDFYNLYGPDGNNNIEVISIETNNNSDENIDALVEEWGISNPVVNLDNQPNQYSSIITGYPHYVIICPDKSFVDVYDFNYPFTPLFWTQSINKCYNQEDFYDLTLLNNQVLHCKDYAKAYLDIGNTGTKDVENMSIDVYVDSVYNSSMELEIILEPLSASSLQQQNIIFESDNINGDLIEFVINHDTDINNHNDHSFHDLTDEIIATDSEITIELIMDNYPSDLTWSLSDENGEVILYEEGQNYSASQLISHSLNLDTNTCYTFNITDSHGDGFCCEFGNGTYNLYSGDELIYSNNSFDYSLTHSFHISNSVAIAEFALEGQKILKTEYYNIHGQAIAKPILNGIYIEKIYFENGGLQVNKIMLLEH